MDGKRGHRHSAERFIDIRAHGSGAAAQGEVAAEQRAEFALESGPVAVTSPEDDLFGAEPPSRQDCRQPHRATRAW